MSRTAVISGDSELMELLSDIVQEVSDSSSETEWVTSLNQFLNSTGKEKTNLLFYDVRIHAGTEDVVRDLQTLSENPVSELIPVTVFMPRDADSELTEAVAGAEPELIYPVPVPRSAVRSGIRTLMRLSVMQNEHESQRNRSNQPDPDFEALYRKYVGFFQNAGDGIVLVSLAGKVLEVNRAFSEMTGLSAEDVIDQSVFSLVRRHLSKAQIPGILKMVRQGLTGTAVPWFALEYNNRHLEIRTSMQNYKFGVIGIIRDVTDRIEYQEILEENEKKYRCLVEALPDAVGIHIDGKLVYCNPAALKLTGADNPEDLYGRPITDFIQQNSYEQVMDRIRRTLNEGIVMPSIAQKFINIQGQVLDVETSAVPFTYRNTPAVLSICRDISEKVNASKDLRWEKEKYHKMVDSMTDGIFLIDPEFRIVDINQTQLKLHKKLELNLNPIGENLFETYPMIDEKSRSEYQSIFRTGEKIIKTDRLNFNGETLITEIRKIPLFEDGRVCHIVTVIQDITEQSETHNALLRSEYEKAAILASIYKYIVFRDRKLNVVWTNHPSSEQKQAFDEMPTRPCYDEIINKNAISGDCDFQQVMETRTPVEIESICESDSKLYSVRIQPVIGRTGEVIGTVELVMDVTKQRQTENELRKEKEKVQTYLDIAGVIILILDCTGAVLQINRKGQEILELPRNEIVGKNWFNCFIEDSIRDKVHRDFQEIVTGKREPRPQYTNPITTREGFERIIAWRDSIIRDESGQITGTLSSGEDITDRWQAENQLRVQKTYFEKLFASSPDAIVLLDMNNSIIMANIRFIELFGYSRAELHGRCINDLIIPEGREAESLETTQVVLDGKLVEFETVRKNKNNQPIDVSVTGAPIILDNSQLAVYGIYRDITDRKQKEKELSNYQEHLQDLVEQRTKELQEKQAQLAHSGRLASLGEMATGVAHELNQPLSIIRAQAELLKMIYCKQDQGNEMDRDLDNIINEVERATRIIDHMRGFARKTMSYPELVDIADPVNGSLVFFREQFRVNDIDLKVEQEANLPKVRINPQKLEQVIVNFMSNARYAVDKMAENAGPGYQRIVTIRSFFSESEDSVVIEVADNGIGMSPDEKEHCIEPFFTTKEVGEGTGLGLSIVHNIIREFQGQLMVDSAPGNGTEFRIAIPAGIAPETN